MLSPYGISLRVELKDTNFSCLEDPWSYHDRLSGRIENFKFEAPSQLTRRMLTSGERVLTLWFGG